MLKSEQILFELDKCSGCGSCVVSCRSRALSYSARDIIFDISKCNFCLDCIDICPTAALTFTIRKIIGSPN